MIRRLRADDAEVFRAVRLEGLANDPAAFGADYEEEAVLPLEHFARRLEENYVVGGFEGEGLAAVAGIQLFKGLKVRHKGLIWGVYTRPAHRGRGLSGRLLEAIMRESRRQGLEWLKLAVSVENSAARSLYEKCGFTVYGREASSLRLDGADYDEDLMSLKL